MKVWYYLDDVRNPPKIEGIRWKVYRDPEEMLKDIVKYGLPDGISFDHDLGENVMSGHDVVKKILELMLDGIIEPKMFEYNVHSANPVGVRNIEGTLRNIEKYVNLVKEGKL